MAFAGVVDLLASPQQSKTNKKMNTAPEAVKPPALKAALKDLQDARLEAAEEGFPCPSDEALNKAAKEERKGKASAEGDFLGGYSQLLFDQLAQTFLNLSMSWHWSLLTISNIGINIMSAAMPFQVTPCIGQVSD